MYEKLENYVSFKLLVLYELLISYVIRPHQL